MMKKQKKMIKLFVVSLLLLVAFAPHTFAQFHRTFSIRSHIPNQTPSLHSYILRNNILMFACGNEVIAYQTTTETLKRYTDFSTGISKHPTDWSTLTFFHTGSVAIDQSSQGVHSNSVYVRGPGSFIYFADVFNNPQAIRTVNKKDVPGMNEGGQINDSVWTLTDNFSGVISLVNESEDLIYFVKTDAIVKIDLQNPDTILKSTKFPNDLAIMDGMGRTPMLHHPIDNAIWFRSNVIARYDLETEIIETFNHNNLPLAEGYRIHQLFTLPRPDLMGNHIVFFIEDVAGFYKLLVFDVMSREWDVEDVPFPTNSVVFDATKNPRILNIFRWPLNSRELAVVFEHVPVNATGNGRNFAIYNTQTKEWRDFIIPISVFNIADPQNEYVLYPRQISWLRPNKTVGILSEYFLIEFDPTVSVEETEYRLFPDLWFQSLYPNPVTQSTTVSANIWCFVPDISTVTLGLYDFMGKKVLDLSNQFEYEQATATIRTTFEIPKSLAKGSYFLVVRSGKETRTKGIIVQ